MPDAEASPRTSIAATSDLVQAPQWALAFRTLHPAPQEPSRLLVLLHGVGGTEEQLAGLGREAAEGTLVVLPRAPRSVGNDMLGWFRISLSGGDAQLVEEAEAEEARCKAIEFVAQCQERHAIAPDRTVLAGFSQGGVLAASVALTAPDRVRGFAVLCGRILPEIQPRVAEHSSLAHLSALLVHGRRDDTLPVGWAERAHEFLQEHGVGHTLRLHDAGHELTPPMRREFAAWHASLMH